MIVAGIHVKNTDIFGIYTVKAGDTLSKISGLHFGDANLYMEIFNINNDAFKNPDVASFPVHILDLVAENNTTKTRNQIWDRVRDQHLPIDRRTGVWRGHPGDLGARLISWAFSISPKDLRKKVSYWLSVKPSLFMQRFPFGAKMDQNDTIRNQKE